MEALDFFRLDSFKAKQVHVPELPLYLPQIRYRTALRGHLRERIYAIRAKEIIRKTHVKTGQEVREALDLSDDQLLVALLFDDDDVLELLYQFPAKVVELSRAGFDLIVSASFSVWSPRPRLHNLRNLIRSLDLCVALQARGAPAIPRLDWQLLHDVRRWVQWLDQNASVKTVAIDAMTCATNGWDDVMEGLALLDELTDKRLRYLVNGPSVERRWADLFSIISPDRLTITDAEPISAPPTTQEKLDFGDVFSRALGPRYGARVTQRRCDVEQVAQQAA
jgi:Domain of unknown function (DUF4417)